MQPYFLPYIGYWQMLNYVDKFVFYDDIEYSKGGWINRNRYSNCGKIDYFTIPLKKDSDFRKIGERYIADSYRDERHKILRRLEAAYRKAPNFEEGYELVKACFLHENTNLFWFIFNSIKVLCAYLDIKTELVVSSDLKIDDSLRKEERIFAICRRSGIDHYINPIGGTALYDKSVFLKNGITLNFHKLVPFSYPQHGEMFHANLSILDVIMFNDRAFVKDKLSSMELV